MNFDVIYQGVNPDKALIYMWVKQKMGLNDR
ncbi:hypothetical protein VCSRO91_3635 [Vibrio cholerae]|nr:hypothetical protein VCSRO91_3635 [Vibrio cholerae]